ncbi:hypothetical protein QUA70_19630 [Microcoleus sp. LAD1_D5]|uniref:hypothetical protein n=1 Tax=Microcoleus sp. LAD1_D5 TaxID=2818813 RepID=UPI002FCFE45A
MLKKITLKDIFTPSSSLQFIGFAVVNISFGLASAGNLWGILLLTIIYWLLHRVDISQRKEKSIGITSEKVSPSGAKGLIMLLGPYSAGRKTIEDEIKARVEAGIQKVFNNSIADLTEADSSGINLLESTTESEIKKQIKKEIEVGIKNILDKSIDNLTEADFSRINFFNSNLEPQIKAVKYHCVQEKTLQEVWLVGSKGSEQTAEILQKYLKFQYGKDIIVHVDPSKFFTDEWKYAEFTAITEKIFQESTIKGEHILVDVTGGTKMMSVALAMACIPPKRKMQYISSDRDWQGNPLPQGQKEPVAIDFDPVLYRGNDND